MKAGRATSDAAWCGDDSHLALNKLGHQFWQAIELILSPPILNHNTAAIDDHTTRPGRPSATKRRT
jgi:hypothetical protein